MHNRVLSDGTVTPHRQLNGDGMANPPANTRPRTVLYVAASETAASDGAVALERLESGPKRSVRAVTEVDRIRTWAPESDCVVFAETPTTAAGRTCSKWSRPVAPRP